MKRINYPYYIFLIAMWPAVLKLVIPRLEQNGILALLIPLYILWNALGTYCIYALKRKNP